MQAGHETMEPDHSGSMICDDNDGCDEDTVAVSPNAIHLCYLSYDQALLGRF